jgi:UDP-3-O-[3-hydroxymyristoyl] glucosamine N-acyltransferase
MDIMDRTLQEIADQVGARVIGDSKTIVSRVASLDSAGPGDLAFVEDARGLAAALTSRASALIAGPTAPDGNSSKPLLICPQPRLAFARAARLLAPPMSKGALSHPSAIVHPTAKLGLQVTIEARGVIAERVAIGDRTHIAQGCVVGPGVEIGSDCEIFPNVTIYPGTKLGHRVIVHAGAVLGSDGFGYVRDEQSGRYEKFPQVGRLEIEDDVEIGANSTIDRGALDATVIRRGTKIDNLVHIGHNAHIGSDVVIAAQTGISGSSVIEDNVIVGGQVGIADHVRIESGAILGAQSGIPSKKVIRGKGVVFWGTPARPIKEYLKELAVLARLAKKQ